MTTNNVDDWIEGAVIEYLEEAIRWELIDREARSIKAWQEYIDGLNR